MASETKSNGSGDVSKSGSAAGVSGSDGSRLATPVSRNLVGPRHGLLGPIQRHVDTLITVFKEKERPLSISNVCGSSPEGDVSGRRDRFEVSLTYCRRPLKFSVVYNRKDLSMAPDVALVGDEGDDARASITLDACAPLREWDASQDGALAYVFNNLLQQYVSFQRSRIAFSAERVRFEAEMVPDAEVSVTQSPTGEGVVTTFILDMPDLRAAGMAPRSPADGRFSLEVKFEPAPTRSGATSTPGGVRIVPLLVVPRGFAVSQHVQVPTWTADTTLVDYRGRVSHALLQPWRRRRAFVTALLERIGAPLEYEPLDYSKIMFMVDVPFPKLKRRCTCLVRLHLLATFPGVAPTIRIQAMQPTAHGTFTSRDLGFPYSPRWEPPEMASRLLASILECATTMCKEALL